MPLQIRMLRPGDEWILANVAAGVFDKDVQTNWTIEFLLDPRHHLAVALDGGAVVGFASAVHYVHPDKPPELWINEIGVASTHQKRGLGRQLMQALFAVGQRLGCQEAWVLTDQANTAANRLYRSLDGSESAAVMYTFKIPAGA